MADEYRNSEQRKRGNHPSGPSQGSVGKWPGALTETEGSSQGDRELFIWTNLDRENSAPRRRRPEGGSPASRQKRQEGENPAPRRRRPEGGNPVSGQRRPESEVPASRRRRSEEGNPSGRPGSGSVGREQRAVSQRTVSSIPEIFAGTAEEEEARRKARLQARQRRNRKRIQQRNRRLALGAVLFLGLAAAGVTILGKSNKDNKEQSQQAYAEQNTETEEKAGNTKVEKVLKTAEESEKDQWYLKLVNGKNPLEEDDLPEIKTVPVNNSVYAVDERIIDSLTEMLSDAYSEGRAPVVCSGYREWAAQEMLFQNKIARVSMETGLTGAEAEEEAATVVARPGTSEHQIGLAVDITASTYTALDEGQMDTEDQQWLMENCWKYGFILRYPVDKTEVTGIIFEPWHYRYVGEKAAKEITEQGITLEEYLGEEPVGDPREA